MPQRRTTSKAVDRAEAQRLYDELKSYRKVAKHLDSNYAAVYRALNPEASVTPNGQPPLPEHSPTDSFRRNVADNPAAQPIVDTTGETVAPPTGEAIVHPVADTPGEAIVQTTVTTVASEPPQPTALATVTPTLQPAVHPTVQATVSRLDQHEARLLALESWIATIQQRPELRPLITSPPPAIFRQHSEPARPRSIQMETDLFDTLRRFCRTEGRQMKEVVDTVLSEFFHSRGWSIEEGE